MDELTGIVKKVPEQKFNLLKRLLLSLFCLGGLLYQSHELLDEYLTGKTVVSLQVGTINSDFIPGITICMPRVFSIYKILQKTNKTAYDKYIELNHKLYYSRNDERTQLLNELGDIYLEACRSIEHLNTFEQMENFGLEITR